MRYDIEAAKSIAYKLKNKFKSSFVPNKKGYNKKKERRKKKVKISKGEYNLDY